MTFAIDTVDGHGLSNEAHHELPYMMKHLWGKTFAVFAIFIYSTAYTE